MKYRRDKFKPKNHYQDIDNIHHTSQTRGKSEKKIIIISINYLQIKIYST